MSWSTTDLGHAHGSGSTLVLSSVTVASGKCIVVVVSDGGNSTAGAVTDSAGNTYNLKTSVAFRTNSSIGQVFICDSASALSSGSITYTPHATSAVGYALSAFSASGQTVPPYDSAVTASTTGSAVSGNSTPSVTSGTPASAGELFVGVVFGANSSGFGTPTYTQDTGNGWATPPSSDLNNAINTDIAGGSLVNSGSGTKTYAPTVNAPSGTMFYGVIVFGLKGPQAYSLTLSPASFSLTGVTARLGKLFSLSLGVGSFALSGIAATLKFTQHYFSLTASPGAFTLSGIATILNYVPLVAPLLRKVAPSLYKTRSTQPTLQD